jgi:cobyrinic acid a,c-diamide synthase
LIIADEPQVGMVSSGLLLVYALKRAGVKVRIFVCARSELEVRLLNLLLEDFVVCLDPYACGSIKNLKTLFQRTANPEMLNVILVPLGTRSEEDCIQVSSEVSDLAKGLACGIVPLISASASAILTTNAALSALSAFDGGEENSVMGVVFASVKNPREFQLLEQDYGRKTPLLSLGYIPKEIERPMPAPEDLYNTGASTRVMQIKSAALQLTAISHQIEWQILEAYGLLKKEWIPPEEMRYPSKHFKAAIVGEKAFSLEGGNSRGLFQFLGCEVVDYNPWTDRFPLDVEVIYFPHSTVHLYGDKLMAHEPFLQGIRQSFATNKLIFANGASALLFGQYFITPDQQKHKGLKIFPFHGSYSSTRSDNVRRIEIRSVIDSIFSKQEEKMRGYAFDHFQISNPGNIVPSTWAYRDIRKGTELGSSGWFKSYCFVTDLYLEPWSCIDIVNRWLTLRRR